MFDKILESLGGLDNIGELAAKVGLSPEQAQSLIQSLGGKLGENGDQISALMEAAKEHGISADSLKDLFQNFTKGEGENPVEDLAEMMAKGLFGGKK